MCQTGNSLEQLQQLILSVQYQKLHSVHKIHVPEAVLNECNDLSSSAQCTDPIFKHAPFCRAKSLEYNAQPTIKDILYQAHL